MSCNYKNSKIPEKDKKYFGMIECAMRNMEKEFFDIEIAVKESKETDSQIRERIYAYELYHRMRCIQTFVNDKEYTINAEPDKSGHTIVGIDYRFNPDIIIHKQGKMDKGDNFLVAEIKTDLSKRNDKGIVKDFRTLACMTTRFRYEYGVFIITHATMEDFCKKIPTLEWNNEEIVQRCLRAKNIKGYKCGKRFESCIKECLDKIYIFAQKSRKDDVEIKSLKDCWRNAYGTTDL